MSREPSEPISAFEAQTLYGLLRARLERTPAGLAYRYYDRKDQVWRALTWRDFAGEVARWQHALAAEGLMPGDRVALNLRNSVEWVAFDQAALGLGLVTVPLYTDDRPDNIAFILRDAGVKLVLVQDEGRWRRLAPATANQRGLRRIVLLETASGAAPEDPRVAAAGEWLGGAAEPLPQEPVDPHGLATIVYTSGTTGHPKGVMLSHHNILSVAEAGLKVVDVAPADRFLSILPLSHALERTVGYYLPMMAGAGVTFGRSVAQLADDLAAARPSVLVIVPRVLERIHARLQRRMRESSVRRRLFALAVEAGWRRFERTQGRAGWHPLLLLGPLLDRLVGAPLRARLGGRLRLAVCGGAPLMPEIARVFIGLGLPLLQGYGLTETSPQVSVNRLGDNEPGSVGPPLPGIDVRTGPGGELQVRSPGNMLGYWNNAPATSAILDREGWLRTGDKARIDGGRIYITGRLKDVLVLSNGEKVPPEEMESAIAMDPLIEQVVVVGEGRPFLSALVVLEPEAWAVLARELNLDPDDPASLQQRTAHRRVVQRIGERINRFPGYAKVRRVHLLLEPWSIENGFMTPTLKIRRGRVLEAYREEIDALYAERR